MPTGTHHKAPAPRRRGRPPREYRKAAVLFDPDVYAAVERRAETEGRSISNMVNWMVKQMVQPPAPGAP
jgi:hypothetical protein